MNIVIVGAQERNTDADRALVEALMELSVKAYPGCLFVTGMTHQGVGRFVREKCLEKNGDGKSYRFQFVDYSVRLFATGLSKAETAQIYTARNATLFEIGDVFLYLSAANRSGTLEGLMDKAYNAGRPYLIYAPGASPELP